MMMIRCEVAHNSAVSLLVHIELSLHLWSSLCFSENTTKSRSEALVADLHSALSDLLAIAKLPATSAGTSLDDLFNVLNLRLAVSKWVEKVRKFVVSVWSCLSTIEELVCSLCRLRLCCVLAVYAMLNQ